MLRQRTRRQRIETSVLLSGPERLRRNGRRSQETNYCGVDVNCAKYVSIFLPHC